MFSIGVNPYLLRTQNILNTANNSLAKSLQRLSTGLRINSAADDPAGYYVSQGLNSQIRGLKTAQNNIAVGASLLGTAEGSLNRMTEMLNRLNDLALQGANTTMTDTARDALTKEANSLVEEIKNLSTNSEFNGIKVFGNGSVTPITSGTVPAGYTAIRTVDDLKKVSGSGKYILMNDIDMSSEANWTGLTLDGGIFDGNGHIIKNLKSTKGGLFNNITDSEIKNVGLKSVDINITATDSIQAGAFADKVYNSEVKNCFVEGNVTQNTAEFSTFGHCITIGGLIGYTEDTDLENCYFSGDIVNKIIHKTTGANITRKINTGSTGGLIGHNLPTENGNTNITNCYASGTISGNIRVAGILGYNWEIQINDMIPIYVFEKDVKMSNCYTDCELKTNDGLDTHNNISFIFNRVDERLLTPTNCIANISKDTTGTIILPANGEQLLSQSDFEKSSTWAQFDGNIWDKASVPPRLKNMPKLSYNFNGSNEFRLQVGSGSDPATNAMFVDTGISMSQLKADLSTTDGCLEAINCINTALDAVAQKTADIGVSQSRLETISKVNTTKIENLTAAYSTVTSANTAEETMNYTKAQIMAETAASLIVQTQAFRINLLMNMINSLG